MKSIFTFIFSFCLFIFVKAQDPHFSQWFAAPMTLNPALAGTMDGTFRISSIYRDQWLSALDDPLQTFAVSGDVKFVLDEGRTDTPDFAAAGIMFFRDQVGTFDLNTTQIALYGAYHKLLNKKNKQYIGFGLQLGIMQRNINYEDLTFQDEFNSLDGYTLTTGEVLPPNNYGYLDLGLGIQYSVAPSKTSNYYLGVSMFHLTSPNISFYAGDETLNPIQIRESKLFRKFSGHAGASFQRGEFVRIQPRILYLKQGPHSEIDLGTNVRFELERSEGKAIHFGPWIRGIKNEDGFVLESLVATVGLELGSFLIGVSYDHAWSDLTGSRAGLNALEVSLTYIGDYSNEDYMCPTF